MSGAPKRKYAQLMVSEARVADEARNTLRELLLPEGYTPVATVDRVHVFHLFGTVCHALLGESSSTVEGRPGVYKHLSSVWGIDYRDARSWLFEIELHGWDAWTEATVTGDRHWLEVPRRQMYAERDRRTADVGADLDHCIVSELKLGEVPGFHAGLSADQVRKLAERHGAPMLDERGIRRLQERAKATRRRRDAMEWPEFEERLAKAIEAMRPETFLIVTTPTVPGESTFYVQFARTVDALRAEAVTSQHLPPDRPLSPAQEARLHELGWIDPKASDAGRNAHRTWDAPVPAGAVARLAVETLRSVYALQHPADLRYRLEAVSGPRPARPALGIEEEPPRPPRPPSTRASGGPRAMRQLRTKLEAALAAWLGVPRVSPDKDGDYPVRAGSALFYVRIADGVPPAVTVFSWVLRDMTVTGDLLVVLDQINSRIRYGRVFTGGRSVMVALDLPAIELTPAHVAFACQELGALADHLDDVLRGRFGGRLAFDSSPKLLN